tara:strand:- start:60 stop:266 length:207 start_codon:yes stop_codon:yes gene_type:complete
MDKIQEIWDYIVLKGWATGDELRLITSINGTNEDSLNSVIYSRAGWHTYEQALEEEFFELNGYESEVK